MKRAQVTEEFRWLSVSRHFLCVECQKYFSNKREFYWHAEECLLESFEHEIRTAKAPIMGVNEYVQEELDDWDDEPTTSTAKSKFDAQRIVEMEDSEKEKYRLTEKEIENTGGEIDKQEDRKEKEDRVKNEQVIVGPRGTKIMVSVEPQIEDQGECSDDEDEGNLEPPQLTQEVSPDDEGKDGKGEIIMEDEEEVEFEEDLELEGFQYIANKKVLGALANASDESGLKPKMECPTCGLVLYRHNFSAHFRIHTGELPFGCDYCGRRFRTTSSLKVHIRAHTGEKPYHCPSCEYSTITKRNLDRHIINHHVRTNTLKGPLVRRSRYRDDPNSHIKQYEMKFPRNTRSRRIKTSSSNRNDHSYMMVPEEEEEDQYEEVVDEIIEGDPDEEGMIEIEELHDHHSMDDILIQEMEEIH